MLTSASVLRRNRPGTGTSLCGIYHTVDRWLCPQKLTRQAPPIYHSCLVSLHIHSFTQAKRLPVNTFQHRINSLPHAICYSPDWGEPYNLTLPGQPASSRSPSRLTSPCLVDRAPRRYRLLSLLQVSPPPPPPLLPPLRQLRPAIHLFTPLKACQRRWSSRRRSISMAISRPLHKR